VKQKNNIFEELNKMKNLIHAKAGVVISEQDNNINADIEAIKKEMTKGALVNSDEQKVVDVLKKYAKDKATLKSFLDQYKTTTGTALTDIITKQFGSTTDQGEIRDLNSVLSKIGVTFEVGINADRTKFVASFKGLDTPAAPANDRQKNINAIFCSVKNGTITNPSSQFNNTPWESWKTTYKPTDAEIEVAKKSCKIGGVGNKSNDYARIVGDYSKKVQTSLGSSPTGQLSDNELEKILTQLNGEVSGEVNQTVQGLPTTADGQPDLEKILASL